MKKQKQSLVLHDGDILCNVPLNILAPKLTLETAKELTNLHGIYMPSKILLKNAQILLEGHKCETCEDVLAVFRPFKVASNAERCGCATCGSSHLGLCRHIPYLDRDSHIHTSPVHPHIHMFPPH
jgi:hypothetical protein